MAAYTDEQRWMMAINTKQVDACRELVEQGFDVNFKMGLGCRPLIAAASKGYLEICKFLLEKGAQVNLADDMQKTALHFAAANNEDEVCRLLLDRGADVNIKTTDSGAMPLYWVASRGNPEIAEMFIEAGADVHAMTAYGMTPLHSAVDIECIDTCAALVEAGADPMFRPEEPKDDYLTPFEMAIRNGHLESAKLFYKTCTIDPYSSTVDGVTLIDLAGSVKGMPDDRKEAIQMFMRSLMLEWSVRHGVDDGVDGVSPTPARRSSGMSPL